MEELIKQWQYENKKLSEAGKLIHLLEYEGKIDEEMAHIISNAIGTKMLDNDKKIDEYDQDYIAMVSVGHNVFYKEEDEE